MAQRNLILIHRGPEYERDFDEIARKVNALDPGITVYHLPHDLNAELPKAAWQVPTLTVSLVPEFKLKVKRGMVFRNHPIEKLAQQEVFRRNGIPTPPALPFRFGMMLDPILFGEMVVVKPMDLGMTSGPDTVFPFRRRQIEQMELTDLPARHLIRQYPRSFMVQRFIDTGPFPRHLRVQTFFGRVICCFESRLKNEEAPYCADIAELRQSVVTTSSGDRERELVIDKEAIELAERAHCAMSHIPTLGFDVVRDAGSRRLYVLECNAGGNTWHFSSESGRPLRESFGRSAGGDGSQDTIGRAAMIDQLGAFDIVAETLLAKTCERAC